MNSAANRKAPSGGYSYPAKAAFREWAWSRIGGYNADGSLVNGHVLLMPSTEALEITEQAIERDFSLSQLHIVDENPAIVATLKRKFPEINTYGVSLEKAIARIDTPLLAANLDFCGNVSRPLLHSVRAVCRSPAARNARVFVTVLRGREDNMLMEALQGPFNGEALGALSSARLTNGQPIWQSPDGLKPTRFDVSRIKAICSIADRSWEEARAYMSVNGQSFLTISLHPVDFVRMAFAQMRSARVIVPKERPRKSIQQPKPFRHVCLDLQYGDDGQPLSEQGEKCQHAN